jgi:superfamily II DNA/RNA helicase
MNGLKDVKYTELTELQEEVIPAVLEGKDALINAENGSSKNASFVIPALEMITKADEKTKEEISVLVLTPNPAESQEIDELVLGLGYHAQIKSASIDLDIDPEEQEELLQSDVQVIVGNPGSLADTIQNLRFIFRHVDLVVIDAADEMVELNLVPKIKNILKRVLSDHQTLIYTNELSDNVQELAEHYLENPTVIGLDDAEMLAEPPAIESGLSHGYIYVPNRMKITTLMAHVEETPTDNCVIFTASKRGTDRLYRSLREQDLKATSLHGKLSDEKRAQRFANFANGDVQYLLVADIPAAELDLDRVTQVINYDVPNDPDEYRYRASLVGSGKASRLVSLVSKQDRSDINVLESKLGEAPKELELPQKVKQKLKERKKGNKSNKSSKKSSKSSNQKKKRRNNGRKKEKSDDLELPRPSFDKLSGGRQGKAKKDQKSGVISLIKELFS